MAIVLAPQETSIWRIVEAIRQLIQGRSNAVGEVTLEAGQTTTVVDSGVSPAAVNVSEASEIFLSPKTATAAAAVPTTFVSAIGQATFTLTHLSTADIDKTFAFEVRGG